MKGPRTKVAGQWKPQSARDADSRAALAKGGGGLKGKQEKGKRVAEKAELDSYKLHKKTF